MQSTMDFICGSSSTYYGGGIFDDVADDVSILEPLFNSDMDCCETHTRYVTSSSHQVANTTTTNLPAFEFAPPPPSSSSTFRRRGTPELLQLCGSLDRDFEDNQTLIEESNDDQNDYSLDERDNSMISEQLPVVVKVLASKSGEDTKVTHSLTPDLMGKLQGYLPPSKRGESFWLRYSLVRDGASIDTLLSNIEDSIHTVMVVETMDGELFGAFTSRPWKIRKDFYGTGESFLWRVVDNRIKAENDDDHDDKNANKNTAITSTTNNTSNNNNNRDLRYDKSLIPTVFDCDDDDDDEDDHSQDLDVFKYAFQNPCIQLCHSDRIALGGGEESTHTDTKYGFGLAFDKDLLRGTTNSCMTFNSPPLSQKHADGSWFEVANLEVWAMTPFETIDQAEKMAFCRKAQSYFIPPTQRATG